VNEIAKPTTDFGKIRYFDEIMRIESASSVLENYNFTRVEQARLMGVDASDIPGITELRRRVLEGALGRPNSGTWERLAHIETIYTSLARTFGTNIGGHVQMLGRMRIVNNYYCLDALKIGIIEELRVVAAICDKQF
jgi:hypothetical protein